MEDWMKIKDSESVESYQMRICKMGRDMDPPLTWQQIADIINAETDNDYSETKYRRAFKYYTAGKEDSVKTAIQDALHTTIENEVKQDYSIPEDIHNKVRMADERNQINELYRRMSREETIKEIGIEQARIMNDKKMLDMDDFGVLLNDGYPESSAILQISDWHYGMEFENYFNKYNPDIARRRIALLLRETIRYCKFHNVRDIHVVNLSDLIAGRIHLQIRLQSRFDVLTQIMEVSEILAEFLMTLRKNGFNVHYYDCIDNHSRLEPDKKQAMNLESLARITHWYLSERIGAEINIHDNVIGDDIIKFNIGQYSIIGVHGDKDDFKSVAQELTMMTHETYDLVLCAHKHECGLSVPNGVQTIQNGTLMGVDDFAYNCRFTGRPSQNLIIVNEYSVVDSLHQIML